MKKTCLALFSSIIAMTAPVHLMGDSPKSASNKQMQQPVMRMKQLQQDISPYKFAVGAQYSRLRQFAHKMPSYSGNLGGIFAEFECKKRNSVYADATFLWNWGSLHADGNPSTGVNEGVWEGDLGGSYSWGGCNQWTITAFTGFGYRRYVNDFDGTSRTLPITIEYQNYFVPVGFKLNYDITQDWRMCLNAKVLPSVDEKLYVYSVTGTYWRQARKPSCAVDLPITWSTNVFNSSYLEVSAVPFFRFWQLGSSEILGFPTWKQIYWGAQANVGLTF